MTSLLIPLASMGTIDTYILELLDHIDIISKGIETDFNLTAIAMSVGLCLAIVAGAYEGFMMLTGKRVVDTMKLLRIVGISLCIANAGTITDMATAPGAQLEKGAREVAMNHYVTIAQLEDEVAEIHKVYIDSLNAAIDKAVKVSENANAVQKASTEGNSGGVIDNIFSSLKETGQNLMRQITGWMIKKTVMIDQKISEWFNAAIRFLGEMLFQICYIAMLLAQRVFLEILKIFAPILFALSLAPPFRSAWSQWLGKTLSVSLWGFLIYFILTYVLAMQEYFIQLDIEGYRYLGNMDGSGDGIQVGGMSSLGGTCYIAIGWFIGVYILRFVPEVASWLIPGGVSSGAGGSAATGASMGTAAATAPVKMAARKAL